MPCPICDRIYCDHSPRERLYDDEIMAYTGGDRTIAQQQTRDHVLTVLGQLRDVCRSLTALVGPSAAEAYAHRMMTETRKEPLVPDA